MEKSRQEVLLDKLRGAPDGAHEFIFATMSDSYGGQDVYAYEYCMKDELIKTIETDADYCLNTLDISFGNKEDLGEYIQESLNKMAEGVFNFGI